MRRPIMKRRIGLLASLAVLLVGSLGCSVDTPTAPDQVPAPPPSTGGDIWSITVSVNPDSLEVGSDVPSSVEVDVRSRADGSRPVNGTTVSVSTTLGDFGAKDSGVNVVGAVLDRGKATVLLFPGGVEAGGTVTARLEGSRADDGFSVGSVVAMFIASVSPGSGSESGGTRVTIDGVGFVAPLRVRFGSLYGTVTDSDSDTIKVVTPPGGPLSSITCDTTGIEYLPTPVAVTVESANGTTATLASGFAYTPDTPGCIGGS